VLALLAALSLGALTAALVKLAGEGGGSSAPSTRAGSLARPGTPLTPAAPGAGALSTPGASATATAPLSPAARAPKAPASTTTTTPGGASAPSATTGTRATGALPTLKRGSTSRSLLPGAQSRPGAPAAR
jgi:hypothetical protein